MRIAKSLRVLVIALVALPILAAVPGHAQAMKAAAAPAVKAEAFDYAAVVKQLKARNIGPANMGGRTVDFAVPDQNTSIIYAAVGPSGLWKSSNAGVTWEPSFVNEATVAVGAVAVAPSAPDIVWVGSGEATARNSVAPGDGVYKSEDAGRTWKNMGLAETRFIARICVFSILMPRSKSGDFVSGLNVPLITVAPLPMNLPVILTVLVPSVR